MSSAQDELDKERAGASTLMSEVSDEAEREAEALANPFASAETGKARRSSVPPPPPATAIGTPQPKASVPPTGAPDSATAPSRGPSRSAPSAQITSEPGVAPSDETKRGGEREAAPPSRAASPQPERVVVGGSSSDESDDAEELDEIDELEVDELEVDEIRTSLPPELPPMAPPSAPPKSGAPARPQAPPPSLPESRKLPWFEEFFSDDYLRTVLPPTPREIAVECDFIAATLGLEPGTTLLDIGCGLGLHAIDLTERGVLVVGLDLSLPMLSRAADEAQERGLRINFLHADMRDMTFEGAFDTALSWGTSFGYFDDETNFKVLLRMRDALRPGGKLLLDVVNRDFVTRSQPNSVWFEGDGCVCMEESKVNHINSRLEVKRTVMLDDGSQREASYSLRIYALHELGQMLSKAGFRVLSVSGMRATPGVFFGADSPRMIILAERKEG